MKNKLLTRIFTTTLIFFMLTLTVLFFIQQYGINKIYTSFKINRTTKYMEELAEDMVKLHSAKSKSKDIELTVKASPFYSRSFVQLYSDQWKPQFSWINTQLLSKYYIQSNNNYYRIGFDKYTNIVYQIDRQNQINLNDNQNSVANIIKYPWDTAVLTNVLSSRDELVYIQKNGENIISLKSLTKNHPIESLHYENEEGDIQPINALSLDDIVGNSGTVVYSDYDDSIDLGYSYISKFMNEQINSVLINETVFPSGQTSVITALDRYTGTPYSMLIRPVPIQGQTYYLIFFITFDNINYLLPVENLNVSTIIVGLIIVAMLSMMFTTYITAPILQIRHVTHSLAQLDFSKKCTVKTGDDIEELGKDINTMAHKLESTLVQLNDEIEKMQERDQFRKLFLAASSHEFRTPLTIIRGIIDGYHDDIFKAGDIEPLLNIEFEVMNLENIVNELITISRSEINSMIYKFNHFQLSDLVQLNINRYRYILDERNVTIEAQLEDGFIYGDEDKLSLVIKNVLSNSIKYSPQNSTITIHVRETDSKMIFSIENEGAPLNAETIDMLWEPFFRHHKHQNKIHGFGIGLYTTKLILTHHESNFELANTDTGVKFQCDFNKETYDD